MSKTFSKQTVLLFLIYSMIYCNPDIQNGGGIPGRTALDNFPLIDGHNDLPWVLIIENKNQLQKINLYNITDDLQCPQCKQTDISKLKTGKVGAQFWVAFSQCSSQFRDSVELTLEQIDVIKRFIDLYSDDLQYVTTADGILDAFKNKRIGSLIAIEGGHSIASRLSILRMYYELGVRYMTLTHLCNTPWADASPLDTKSINNITDFGKKVVWEMNRLGMIVDLSHVSYGSMVNALKLSRAPVIFSHSSAYAVHAHHRNVRDDVLQLLKTNHGIIMINTFPYFIGAGEGSIEIIARHIDHLVDECGIDCVGIGADFSGIEKVSAGFENVSKYPDLFDFLKQSNSSRWTINNLEKLAGRNFIRVFKAVERVKESLKDELPIEDWIPEEDLNKWPEMKQCKTVPHY